MKLVMLSGGSGKRLWPLSNSTRSKQFLKVLEDPDGKPESMIQRVWRQINSANLTDATYISANRSQLDIITSQLGSNVQIILEPTRRDTFPAMALATSFLHNIDKVSPDEVVVIVPVDPFVSDNFFHTIRDLAHRLESSASELGLIGALPTFPSSKYGYILPSEEKADDFVKVSKFVEKPDEEAAALLISQGALWNCGVFAFKLKYILDCLESRGIPSNYHHLNDHYMDLPKVSFDYEVVEKASSVSVLPYFGDWKDLGTWNTLTEHTTNKANGNGILFDSHETHLINELDIPVYVLGINEAVVVASPDGILVANKEKTVKLKDFLPNHDNRPMFEERRWGWYRILDYVNFGNDKEVLTKRICIKEGNNLSYQYHQHRTEVWNVIRGNGILALSGELRTISEGDIITVFPEIPHAIRALTDLEIIETQTGFPLIEEDIVRLHLDWVSIENHCRDTSAKANQ